MAGERAMRQVVIYSKPGCHLCEEVKAELQKLQAAHPFELTEVNILADPATFATFKHEIPVVFVDGKQTSAGHFEALQFLRQLEEQTARA